MIASMASYCSGTAGWPKWRSEQWKRVVVRRSPARFSAGPPVAEEVRRHDHVESLGMEHEIHRHGVDDALLELDASSEIAGDHTADVEEETLSKLEDVGFVNQCHLAASVLHRVLEGVPNDALRSFAGDDRDRLRGGAGVVTDFYVVLDADVQTLRVLTNEHEIEILISTAGQYGVG